MPVDAFRRRLVDGGLLVPTAVRGVFGRGAVFEDIVARFDRYVTSAGHDDGPEVLRFPPVLARDDLARSGFVGSFPNLAGSVHSFTRPAGEHAALVRLLEAGHEWAGELSPTGVALTPAACYPVYPMATGTLPPAGRLFDVMSYCFRHEPSDDPSRMQAFRMHEYVRLGTPAEVSAFRDRWLERGQAMLAAVELPAEVALANDPFFGRRGQLLAASQREQSLKFELVVPIANAAAPTAIASCNYHRDHLTAAFSITTSDGEPAHSACVGFGLERIALALFATHGLEPGRWPRTARATLGFPAA